MVGKWFLPVIHVLNEEQMLRNLTISKNAGADGVFLINHGILTFRELLRLHSRAVLEFPDWWIGVNCLDLSGVDVFQFLDNSVSGVWVDNGGIDGKKNIQAKKILFSKENSSWNGLYFGGVSFKYQNNIPDDFLASSIAMGFMDIITTSGPATGKKASVEKISIMKHALGSTRLALASGVTCDNVIECLPFVDIFLVATGISDSFYELNPVKVSSLSNIIHTYE